MRVAKRPGADYLPGFCRGAGFGAVGDFFAGVEMPMLIKKKPKPLRREARILTILILSRRLKKTTSGESSTERAEWAARALQREAEAYGGECRGRPAAEACRRWRASE